MPPVPNPPLLPLPQLADHRVSPPIIVAATVSRGFAADRLAEVERSWTPARDALGAAMRAAGLRLENSHGRWTRKDASVRAGQHLLLAAEAGGEVQGLLALNTELRPASLLPGRWIRYVDYVEAAPWNLQVASVQNARYSGVGTLLIAEAIRTSLGRVAGGRIGLHSLPQAERFYTVRCRMTRVGPDPLSSGLVYYEYQDGVAAEWLSDEGFST